MGQCNIFIKSDLLLWQKKATKWWTNSVHQAALLENIDGRRFGSGLVGLVPVCTLSWMSDLNFYTCILHWNNDNDTILRCGLPKCRCRHASKISLFHCLSKLKLQHSNKFLALLQMFYFKFSKQYFLLVEDHCYSAAVKTWRCKLSFIIRNNFLSARIFYKISKVSKLKNI